MRSILPMIAAMLVLLLGADTARGDSRPIVRSAARAQPGSDSATTDETGKEAKETEKTRFRDGDWGFALRPYLYLAGSRGTMTVLDQSADVDIPLGEELGDLEFFFMGQVHARWRDLVLTVDALYGDLASGIGDVAGTPARAGIDIWVVDSYAKYGFAFGDEKDHRLELLAGVRYVSLDLGLRLFQGPNLADDHAWYAPMVGLEYTSLWSDKWEFRAHGDIGGFDLSDDFSWVFNGEFGRRFFKRCTLWFGYKLLDVKKNWGSPPTAGGIDLLVHGPTIGWEWAF